MSHQPRLHAAGAHYYVVQRCCPGQQIFEKEEDYRELSSELSHWVKRYQIRIHAFRWAATEIHLIVQVRDKPLSQFMRPLTQMLTYRKTLQAGDQPLLSERYSAVLFDPDEFLLRAVRFMHSGAELEGWCSHRAYIGQAQVPWLTTFGALGKFNRHKVHGQHAYLQFMETPPSDEDREAFSKVSSTERRVLGGSIFLNRMGLKVRPWKHIDVAKEIEVVSRRLGVALEDVCSRSRGREITEVRAAIAHELKKRRGVSQAAAARVMGRCPSTLNEIAANHRPSELQRARMAALRPMGPVLSQREITALLSRPAWSASR